MTALNTAKTLENLINLRKELASEVVPYQKDIEIILSNIDRKLLTPLNEIVFSTSIREALRKANLKTVEDVLSFGLNNLLEINDFGRSKFIKVKSAIVQFIDLNQIGAYLNKIREIRVALKTEKEQNNALVTKLIQETPEEKLLRSTEKKMLETPLDDLDFSTRLINGLKKTGLKTVEDVLMSGFNNLLCIKNYGAKSQTQLKDNIYRFCNEKSSDHRERKTENNDASFATIMGNILSSLHTESQLQVIKARYGYDDGKKKTLEIIGNKTGLSRERIRQIIFNAHKYLNHSIRKIYFQIILERIESVLLLNRGVVGINDLANYDFFSVDNTNNLKFLINLLADVYKERYRIIEKRFLTSLNKDEIKMLQSEIREAVLKCKFPIKEIGFIEDIISSIGPISKEYLHYYLLNKERIIISKGQILSPGRLSIPQKVKLIMRDIDIPMHFTKIGKLYREYFGDANIKTVDLDRTIHARIGDSKDFIIVGPGIFILRDKFITPINIHEIVESSREILGSVNNIYDTKYLIEKLKQRRIDVGSLNAYSLKPILLEYPGFVRYGKFEIGLEELSDQYERRSLSDLLYDILIKARIPMHSSEIWKHISKQRGFPRYTIEQRLYKDTQFIKVAPSTYAIKEIIPSYEIKYVAIVNFAKEWIHLKGHAVSAFFVNEVLKATEEIKDLSMGLVEHVLATSPEFTRVSNGFYDLVSENETSPC
ncbi:MAG: hypothetical protein HY753_04835 [Nitrospirae bacterium]|nr:hypothetical protein [Nitrospirota bacterium]